nr:trimethylguanosine synthase [Quercus suber]
MVRKLEPGHVHLVLGRIMIFEPEALERGNHEGRMPTSTNPPDGVHHYTTADEVPFEISKYWHQRYKIFSRFDEGIWMTDEACKIATQVATAPASRTVIIDAFAGAGGNAIAFALSRRWNQVWAVERDPKVIACAKHNADIYGVANNIWWIEGDVFEQLRKRLKTVAKDAIIFGSPPWGGPTYADADIFNLDIMEPYPIQHLHNVFSATCNSFVLYLPRTSDLRQVARFAKDEKLKVIHYCIQGASKAICVFFGKFELD